MELHEGNFLPSAISAHLIPSGESERGMGWGRTCQTPGITINQENSFHKLQTTGQRIPNASGYHFYIQRDRILFLKISKRKPSSPFSWFHSWYFSWTYHLVSQNPSLISCLITILSFQVQRMSSFFW